jgi:hypothetical protein
MLSEAKIVTFFLIGLIANAFAPRMCAAIEPAAVMVSPTPGAQIGAPASSSTGTPRRTPRRTGSMSGPLPASATASVRISA